MTEQQIRENLCIYDKRNPNFDPEGGDPGNPCYCDNCFNRRNELARELLAYQREIKELRQFIRQS